MHFTVENCITGLTENTNAVKYCGTNFHEKSSDRDPIIFSDLPKM